MFNYLRKYSILSNKKAQDKDYAEVERKLRRSMHEVQYPEIQYAKKVTYNNGYVFSAFANFGLLVVHSRFHEKSIPMVNSDLLAFHAYQEASEIFKSQGHQPKELLYVLIEHVTNEETLEVLYDWTSSKWWGRIVPMVAKPQRNPETFKKVLYTPNLRAFSWILADFAASMNNREVEKITTVSVTHPASASSDSYYYLLLAYNDYHS